MKTFPASFARPCFFYVLFRRLFCLLFNFAITNLSTIFGMHVQNPSFTIIFSPCFPTFSFFFSSFVALDDEEETTNV
jgi:hypothetical protein